MFITTNRVTATQLLSDYKVSKYTQSPLIRTTAKLPTLGVLKNSSNLEAHWFLIPQVGALAGS